MPVFNYKALKGGGANEVGVIDADSPKEARLKLRLRKLHVTELVEVKSGTTGQRRRLGFQRKGSLQDLGMITRQMGTLLNSGIPLMGTLSAVIEQAEDRVLKTILLDVREKVAQGASLSSAMEAHTRTFSELYVNMIRAGEAAGTLDKVLFRIADYLQAQYRVQQKVVAALTYPFIMAIIGISVVVILLAFVVPKILDVLQRTGKTALPLPTEILLLVSGIFQSYWWLMLVVCIILFLIWRQWVATPQGRMDWDTFKLRVPVLGSLLRKAAVSRFCMTFATLLESGLPVLDALVVVKRVVNNALLSKTLDEVRNKITEGADIATPLKQSKVFPPVVGYMIAVGEESGRLEDLLKRIAQSYDEEVEIAAQRLTAMLEPIMIVVMAVVVGFVVLSILLPIFEISNM